MNPLEPYIRDIQDFPKAGILFKDITPLLLSPEATDICLDALLDQIQDKNINKVVGIEARGFFFGTMLADRLDAGFIPVRKPGKLPYKKVSAAYELEYGVDTLEMHEDAITKGDRVLIHDDVLATGGTAQAVCKMVENLGGDIVQCNFIMELSFLNGRDKLNGQDVKAAITY